MEKNGKKTTIYIGKEGSPAHKKAIAAQQARRQLKSVLKQIALLQKHIPQLSAKTDSGSGFE